MSDSGQGQSATTSLGQTAVTLTANVAAATKEEEENPIKVSPIFNDPTSNVVFKTSDNVLFRVDDFYLKANSGVFRDMLSSSIPSSSTQDPLPVEERSSDFSVMLLIITGRPYDAVNEPKSWRDAARLYRMMDKYQLDGHQPWFSELCGRWVKEAPLEALFLACNRPSIDTTLARYAIEDARWMMAPPNTTLQFGLDLGFKGLLAYNLTFADIRDYAPGKGTPAEVQDRSPPRWRELAINFVDNARRVEQQMQSPQPKPKAEE